MKTSATLDIECREATAIVTPAGNMGEFAYAEHGQEIADALQWFDELPEVKNVVIDFANSDYFGSSALGLMVRLWKRVRLRGGMMAVCNLSEHETEILRACRLDHFWSICSSREQALAEVGESTSAPSGG
jgi:anti-anti-sigma factor